MAPPQQFLVCVRNWSASTGDTGVTSIRYQPRQAVLAELHRLADALSEAGCTIVTVVAGDESTPTNVAVAHGEVPLDRERACVGVLVAEGGLAADRLVELVSAELSVVAHVTAAATNVVWPAGSGWGRVVESWQANDAQ